MSDRLAEDAQIFLLIVERQQTSYDDALDGLVRDAFGSADRLRAAAAAARACGRPTAEVDLLERAADRAEHARPPRPHAGPTRRRNSGGRPGRAPPPLLLSGRATEQSPRGQSTDIRLSGAPGDLQLKSIPAGSSPPGTSAGPQAPVIEVPDPPSASTRSSARALDRRTRRPGVSRSSELLTVTNAAGTTTGRP